MIEKLFLILKIIMSGLMLGLSIYLLYILKQLAIVPDKYYLLLIGILAVLNIFTIIGLFVKNKILKIVSILLFLIIGVVDIVGIKYTQDTEEFLNNAFV